MKNHWILTCNPERWRFFEFLADGNAISDIGSWSVVRYVDLISAGDDVALWVTGNDRGVYATGRIAGVPEYDQGGDYWAESRDRDRSRYFVPIELDHDLTSTPILGRQLAADPRFARASVLRVPWAGNPHQVTDGEWEVISELGT